MGKFQPLTSIFRTSTVPPGGALLNKASRRRECVSDHRFYAAQRSPKPSTFKPKMNDDERRGRNLGIEEEKNNLTKLQDDAPMSMKRQAWRMYAECKLSGRDPVTRFAIVRQMRNLDLPPHRELWQRIEAEDELALYRWVDEAFGQLVYQKSLWRPSLDWGPEDDQTEAALQAENHELLRQAYEEQIVNPLKESFGESELTIALSNLPDHEKLFIEPAIIWRSVDKNSGETCLEWMSEYTADVVWPGLVSCRPDHTVARRHWEAEARLFAKSVGGVPYGMGPNREALPPEPEDYHNQNTHEHKSAAARNRHFAEKVLIKKFLEDRNQSSSQSKK